MPNFIKLDYDWRSDPKVAEFEVLYGKRNLVDVVEIFILMSRYKGVIDLNNAGVRRVVEARVGRRGKQLDAFLDRCAECGIVDAGLWHGMGHVTSERAARDAQKAYRRAECALAASRAAAERRASERESQAASVD